MADHKTSWILELVDEITKPLKNITGATDDTRSTVEKVTQSINDLDGETRAFAERSLKTHRDLTEELEQEREEVKKLTDHLDSLGDEIDPLLKSQIDFDIKKAQTKARRYEEQLANIEEELEQIENGPDPAKLQANWGAAVVVANQTAELVEKALSTFDFAVGIEETRTQIQRMTGETGDRLDELTAKAHRLGRIYKEDPAEIARAANAMTKQVGGSFDENFALIEAGYQKGANINKDFLDQLKEYPTFIKQSGLAQSEAIAVITDAAKNGIYSDKAIDAIKEGTNSIQEMGKIQIDALAGIGISPDELENLTPFQALQKISKAMEDADVQAKQMALTDIFKGAGEDAGLPWIERLWAINTEIEKLENVEETGGALRGWLADLESSFANTFGSIVTNANELSGIGIMISSMIPIIQTLSKVTWIQNVATKAMTAVQWLWNAALNANPIGLIILGVTALVALVYSAIDSFDSWGSTVLAFMGPIGILISGIMMISRQWDSIVEAFESDGIVGGLKRLGIVLLDVLMHPLQRILGWVAELTGWDWAESAAGSVEEFRKKMDLVTEDEQEKEKEKEEKKSIFPDAKPEGGTVLDGLSDLTGGKKGTGTGTASAPKMINQTLNITNNFNVKDGADFMRRKDEILDYVVGRINDVFKDATIAAY